MTRIMIFVIYVSSQVELDGASLCDALSFSTNGYLPLFVPDAKSYTVNSKKGPNAAPTTEPK
jgi:hypothetical protein